MGVQESSEGDVTIRLNTVNSVKEMLGRVKVKTSSDSIIYLANEMAFLRLRRDVDELIRGLLDVENTLENASLGGEASILEALRTAGVTHDVFQNYLRFLVTR